ncbi:hypothetical protein GCM10010145_02480 [Streptomyces ruber]|uniref:Uncharacterized protein n=2 Tax=Streptomyces TaxID=1883 RepID=A0A918EPU5_9ACTN|nr:hypothetical protein GCM10010145_02480 [Streptomyces ruber]
MAPGALPSGIRNYASRFGHEASGDDHQTLALTDTDTCGKLALQLGGSLFSDEREISTGKQQNRRTVHIAPTSVRGEHRDFFHGSSPAQVSLPHLVAAGWPGG